MQRTEIKLKGIFSFNFGKDKKKQTQDLLESASQKVF